MIYTIKKNKHRSRWFPKLTFQKSIKGTFKFIGDVYYDGNSDTNKLIGLSDNLHHHIDSIRIGWRWNKKENKLEIMGICYNNFNREIRHLCFVESNRIINFEINIYKYSYRIDVDGSTNFFMRGSNWGFIRYYLFPFFGGKEKSPKEFKISIEQY